MKRIVYFDHNATTHIRDSVKKLLIEMYDHTGNVSSTHRMGAFMKRELEESRYYVAELLKIMPGYIVWTSGATESNNTVIRGYQGTVIVSSIEHPSIYEAREDVIVCPVDKNGVLNLDILESLLKQHTQALVCVMAAHNETGVIQPLKDIISLVHQYNGFIFLDCVQAVGKIDVPYSDLDGFSMSGHKIGTPYGVGILSLKPTLKIDPLIVGGGQERYKRSGSVNVYGAIAFAKALEEVLKENWDHVKELRDHFEREMKKINSEIIVTSEKAMRLPNTSGIVVPKMLNSTQMMHYDIEGFCIASGSACSSGTMKAMRILDAMQYPQELASCFIRISFGQDNTKEEVNQFLNSTQRLYERKKHA